MLKAPVYRSAHGRAATLLCRLAGTAALLVGAQVALAQDTTEPATADHRCAEEQHGSKLNCTANDFVVTSSAMINNNTVGSCPNDGQVHVVDILLGLQSASPDRYNVGYFVGQTGNDPTAAGGQCSVAIFPLSGGAGWYDADSNACGDYHGPGISTTNLVTNAKVTCIEDASHHLVVPYAIVYSNSTGGTCTSVDDVDAQNSSKCQAATVPVGNVFVTNDANPVCHTDFLQDGITFDGTTITATVTVTNDDALHTQSADGVTFLDDFTVGSPAVTVQTVSCTPNGGATCTIVNTAGVVTGSFPLFPFGSSVDLTVTLTLPGGDPGNVPYSTGLSLTTPANVLPPNRPPWVTNTDPQSPGYGSSTLSPACLSATQLPVKLQNFDVR